MPPPAPSGAPSSNPSPRGPSTPQRRRPDARRRFSAIAAALAAAPGSRAITTGFAELTADDTVTELIARADSELIAIRRRSRAGRPDPAVDPSADRPR
jgi:hypothetical protein